LTDLAQLLREMQPVLDDRAYAIETLDLDAPLPTGVFALIHEPEGMTLIAPFPDGTWARISLSVHSSLSAVGLTAAISRALADASIPANIVAGYHHDHLFVPWNQRQEAMQALTDLSEHPA
jgi:uncharacterized protein